MDKVQFLVFNKLNLDEYKIIDSDLDDMIGDIEKEIGRPEGGCSTNTSSWMNRFPCLENGDKTYIIIPYYIPSYNDIIKATLGKYAILLSDGKGFVEFSEEDIKYFQKNFPYEFDINKRKQREEEKEEQYAKLVIRDSFRLSLLVLEDETVEIIRYLIINNKKKIFEDMVCGGIAKDIDILTKIYNKMKKEPEFKDISISVDDFAEDIMVFFRPEIQFMPLGIDLKTSVLLYVSLCDEDDWLRDLFLGISEKEVRDAYREFMGKFK